MRAVRILLDYTRRARVARRTDCVGTTLIFMKRQRTSQLLWRETGVGKWDIWIVFHQVMKRKNVRNGPGFDLGSSPWQANYAQRASRTECDRRTDGRTNRKIREVPTQ